MGASPLPGGLPAQALPSLPGPLHLKTTLRSGQRGKPPAPFLRPLCFPDCAPRASVSSPLAAQSPSPDPTLPGSGAVPAQKALGAGVPARLALTAWSRACL